MTLVELLLMGLAGVFLLPFILFTTVKLCRYAWLQADWIFKRDHPDKEKTDGDET